MKKRLSAVAIVLGLCVSAAAQASAHNSSVNPRFFHGYYGTHAIVTGTVTAVASDSFTANAYVVTPGAGNSSAPTTTSVTITPGTTTKLSVDGKRNSSLSAVAVGDNFYAVYQGVSSTDAISTITGDTPTIVVANVPPIPHFEVEGVITTAPDASNPDTFTATAEIVEPHRRGAPKETETTGVTINVADTTKFDVNGNRSATVSDLAAGQKFEATFTGAESSASLSALPEALSVDAQTVYKPYGFVGTVTAEDTTDSPNTVTVAVTQSVPSGLFSGTETFTLGSKTRILSLSGHKLSNIAVGDTVAGGVIAPEGESASQIEATALKFLVDVPNHGARRNSKTARKHRTEGFKKAESLLGLKSGR